MKTIAGRAIGNTAIFQITKRGKEIASKLKSAQGSGALIYTPAMLKKSGLRALAKKAFHETRGLIFISAAGIAVRAIAALVGDKTEDPAVVVVDDAGRFSISLLSGHLGGANELAEKVARAIGAVPVITTATDGAGRPCAEDIAKRFSLAIENSQMIKKINSAILDGGAVTIVDGDAKRRGAIKKAFGKAEVFGFSASFSGIVKKRGFFIYISALSDKLPAAYAKRALIMRPREFVLGLGCKRGVTLKEVAAAAEAVFKKSGIAGAALRNIATIDVKSNEAGILAYARQRGLHVDLFSAAELNTIEPPSGVSKAAYGAVGAKSVCEAAAMLSAGTKETWIKKIISGRVTAALARARYTS